MSTREIASVTKKEHANIKISAERLAAKGIINRTLAVQEFTHNGNIYEEYLLNKRDSIILVAQNCPEFTAAIVDRWQELESGAAQPRAALPADAAPQFKALFDIATLIGCDSNMAAISANQGTIAATGLNLLGMMGLQTLPSPEQAIYYTPTELGKQCTPVLSAVKVNQTLAATGLQENSAGHWQPTEKGKPYARVFDTGKKHNSGAPVQQVKWLNKVLKVTGLLNAS